MSPVYDEIIDFMARRLNARDIDNFRASEAASERVSDLIYKEKTEALTPEEKTELDDYMRLEHLMRMLKARARHHLANNG